MRVVNPHGGTTITTVEAISRYGSLLGNRLHKNRRPIRVFEGGLSIRGDLLAEHGRVSCQEHLIVDGDLTVTGLLEWWDDEWTKVLLVTGNMRVDRLSLGERVDVVVGGDLVAQDLVDAYGRGESPTDADTRLSVANLRAARLVLAGHVDVTVREDLLVTGEVTGKSIDRRGSLTVHGRTRCRMVWAKRWFTMTFAEEPEADVLRGNLPRTVLNDELTRLARRPDDVFELDLKGKDLPVVPEAIRGFTNLRRLGLSHNYNVDSVPDWIAELTGLTELDLSSTTMTTVPAALARLSELTTLKVSNSEGELLRLPDHLGRLTNLRVLHLEGAAAPVPNQVADLVRLEELNLQNLGGGKPVEFPGSVTRLPKLRVLKLAKTRLTSVPDELASMDSLEELDLGDSLGLVRRLPVLARLPRLRALRVDGHMYGRPCGCHSPSLLEQVWEVTTLEELNLNFWGGLCGPLGRTRDRVSRQGPFTLPNHAFAVMPRLRTLNLISTWVTTLPESFYALRELVEVHLDFASLDSPTRRRLAELANDERDNPAFDWIRTIQVRLLIKAGRSDAAQKLARQVLTRRPDFVGLADFASAPTTRVSTRQRRATFGALP